MHTGHQGAARRGKTYEKRMLVPHMQTGGQGRKGPLALVLGLSIFHYTCIPTLPPLLLI